MLQQSARTYRAEGSKRTQAGRLAKSLHNGLGYRKALAYFTSERMSITYRGVSEADASAAAELVRESFTVLAAGDWEPRARQVFLGESSAEVLRQKLKVASYAAAAFDGENMAGFLLMPSPSLLGMLFVHPQCLRRGIARELWEQARSHIEGAYPTVQTVELNATPCAEAFFRTVGFVPISAQFNRQGCRATRMACWLPARALGADSSPSSSSNR